VAVKKIEAATLRQKQASDLRMIPSSGANDPIKIAPERAGQEGDGKKALFDYKMLIFSAVL
jgi:hypothetical protein